MDQLDPVNPVRIILSFMFVLGLIGCMGLALKRYKNRQLGPGKTGSRLDIVETKFIDSKHRLVIVRKDEREYLILLAEGRETVIESAPRPVMMAGITQPANDHA